jgi:hypothetical protein
MHTSMKGMGKPHTLTCTSDDYGDFTAASGSYRVEMFPLVSDELWAVSCILISHSRTLCLVQCNIVAKGLGIRETRPGYSLLPVHQVQEY